jgi:hypothetical protein
MTTHRALRHSAALAAILGAAIFLPSCLKRHETIVVHADGSLEIEHRLTGDRGDLEKGAATPPGGAPWSVTAPAPAGGQDWQMTARAHFRSAAGVPSSFAASDDPLADVQWRWSTEVTVERRGRATRYLFVRTYEPRAWARYARARRRAVPEEVEQLMKDGKQAGPEAVERQGRIGAALLDYERLKHHEWSAAALDRLDVSPVARATAQTAAESAIDSYFHSHLGPGLIEEILRLSDSEIERRARAIDDGLTRATEAATIAALGAAPELRVSWADARERVRRDHDVTQDLEDETIVVELTLPGRVLGATMGGKIDGSHVTFELAGKDLRDAPLVISAHSESSE